MNSAKPGDRRTAKPDQTGQVPPNAEWIRSCVELLRRVDPSLSDAEAREVARELHTFERTGAMPPESAVQFVLAELRSKSPRFERRSPKR